MKNFIVKKQGKGNYKVEVIIDHEFRGEFNTTDATLIDDINGWMDGDAVFYFADSREELELYVLKLAELGETDKQKCQELYDKISDAFHNQSGGDYNDTMYWQWQGASEEMLEADEDGDWAYALKNLTQCWKYVEVCKLIDDLQSNMPEAVYC